MLLSSISAPITSGSFEYARIPNAGIAGGPILLFSGSSYGRRGGTIANHSNATLYVAPWPLTGSTTTGYMVKLTSGSYYELSAPVYLDAIYGAWDGPGGFAMIVDFQSGE